MAPCTGEKSFLGKAFWEAGKRAQIAWKITLRREYLKKGLRLFPLCFGGENSQAISHHEEKEKI